MPRDESTELAERHCKEKDPDAFPRLYDLNWRCVRTYARRLGDLWNAPRFSVKVDYEKKEKKKKPVTQDEARLSNICSDVWMVVVKKLCTKFDMTRSFRSWVLGITRFKVMEEQRRFKEEEGLVRLETEPGDPKQKRSKEQDELREDVEAALLRLDVHLRRVIVLRYFEKLTIPAMAVELQLPDATVWNHIQKALKELRPHLLRWARPSQRKKD